MKTVPLSELRMSVRKRIDELRPNDAGFECVDLDSVDLDRIIDGNAVGAVAFVHSNAGRDMVADDSLLLDLSCASCAEGSDIVVIKVPRMLRFVSLKAKDSCLPVTDLHDESEVVGRMQHNPFTRGTYEKPVLVRTSSSEGNGMATMKYYSLKSVADEDTGGKEILEYVRYLPIPEIDTAGQSIDICPHVEECVYDYLAGLVLNVYGDGRAAGFLELSKSMMNL